MAASLLPWREGVARQIETEHAFGPKVSAAMLRKALSKTSREVAEIDAYWICDKKGVHVEKFQGQPIDLEQRTISYADLAELIKGLPKAEAATSQESPAADAPTEAKAAKFGDVPDDWKQRIAAKLQERQKYFEPPTVKELRADVGVPGSVSDQDVSVVFLSDAIKCNHVAGVDCDLSLPWKEAADLLKVIIESKTKPGDRPAA